MDELMEQYAQKFGEGFPSFQICGTVSDDEAIKIIKDCLAKGKDAYALGYCTDDMNIEY